jgi:hypothetical protein
VLQSMSWRSILVVLVGTILILLGGLWVLRDWCRGNRLEQCPLASQRRPAALGEFLEEAFSSARRRRVTWYWPAPNSRISSSAATTRSFQVGVG